MSQLDFYETDRALAEYLLFHYGTGAEILPWQFGPANSLGYPVRCVSECVRLDRLPAQARALDLGCSVGRSAFELARHCVEVVGIDYSRRFIDAARHLQQNGFLDYRCPEEGDLTTAARAEVPRDIPRQRVVFERGDALALRPGLGPFDVVLLANLVDRLADPRRCLESLPALTAPRGQLVITTPCTWLEDYTARANWLGGFQREGQPVRTLDALQGILEPHFLLDRTQDLPFLIREHRRKYQWSVALATVWVKR